MAELASPGVIATFGVEEHAWPAVPGEVPDGAKARDFMWPRACACELIIGDEVSGLDRVTVCLDWEEPWRQPNDISIAGARSVL
eukprot:CAMPEP_0115712164 /NCGR_PEP_ID=MMETSP0272-20121206/73975_1 /TAXON_ID=71861 /ORGANISM="Scrippsiella trochoidea, Strain CCMP3099" /LENGTH=83 /DNA_ID=CAMNT_0003154055 /DNA_START=198 /DNA_END=446 /DNA_ORIENTATION=-